MRGTEVVGPPIVVDGEIVDFQPVEQREFAVEEFDEAWNLFETSAALVYDNALLGYTSPFAGRRYRFEVTPTLGSLQFVQALADYRQYLWLRPFTLAFQGIHFGRYGKDAESNFNPLFLGQPSLVRGYWEVYDDCRAAGEACDGGVTDLLFGSRLLVAKAELRFPLIRRLDVGGLGFPPIEGFGFADAGAAWNQEEFPALARGEQLDERQRGWVSSAGVGARINLFGFAVAEINLGYSPDLPKCLSRRHLSRFGASPKR